MNNATCTDHVNSFSCACVAGYTGVPCDVDIDECANVTCQNNATCVEGLDWYRCDCVPGYTGEHCETGKPGFCVLPLLIHAMLVLQS